MIHVLIRARNAEKYIGKCLRSLYAQTHQDWKAWVFLDDPTDNTEKILREYIGYGGDVEIVVHPKRIGLGRNMFFALDYIKAAPEDIIAVVDGDDKLRKRAFKKVHKSYIEHNCLVTYGSYIKLSKGRKTKISRPYKPTDNVRKAKWHGSHLKTFKVHLAKRLTPECFQDSKGNWLDAASDLALMFPIMEMAGLNRCHHISKPIYYWRDGHSDSTKRSLQIKCEKIVRGKKKWQRA